MKTNSGDLPNPDKDNASYIRLNISLEITRIIKCILCLLGMKESIFKRFKSLLIYKGV